MKIVIGSFNIKNTDINKSGGINDYQDNALELSNIIKSNHFDIIGFQEMTMPFSKRLISFLNDFKIIGKFRYGRKVLTKFKIFRDWNESSSIMTRFSIISSKTYYLPWIPRRFKDLILSIKSKSLMPRLLTVVKVKYHSTIFYHLNTHLEKNNKILKKIELNKILKIISKLDKPFIITGDFNMTIDDDLMLNFCEALRKYHTKRININDKTYKKFDKAIDHIFIPFNWNINESGVIESDKLKLITDHNVVFAKVSIK